MRNPLVHPVPITLGLLTLGVLALPIPGKLPLLLLGAIAWLGSIAILSMRGGPETHASEADPEERMLLKPIERLHGDLTQIVQQNLDLPAVKVIGEEAIAEAGAVLDHARKLVSFRSDLLRTLRRRSEAEIEIGKLRERASRAGGEGERRAYETAIEAHETELGHYSSVERAITQIDGKLSEAQAALSELKARLAVGAAGARTEGIDPEELTTMVGRLKSLTRSFDEAESAFEVHRT
ncbi:MAG TPA: hypothetical protein PLL78_06300 [Fimbriimonadaceae bacterium]|nr:hypothetical protein [Fimbriimonadaceae bacterium]HRJ96279.1 hypothetical protein [Fimbriimonadaceae bacterium]